MQISTTPSEALETDTFDLGGRSHLGVINLTRVVFFQGNL